MSRVSAPRQSLSCKISLDLAFLEDFLHAKFDLCCCVLHLKATVGNSSLRYLSHFSKASLGTRSIIRVKWLANAKINIPQNEESRQNEMWSVNYQFYLKARRDVYQDPISSPCFLSRDSESPKDPGHQEPPVRHQRLQWP